LDDRVKQKSLLSKSAAENIRAINVDLKV
jgi:hypothetical protein